ncbi:hypothetical protein F511_36871 [Dorcoceras hygrometricum]|uniref:Uncharacterized protein n=1 Tax=Dorcoceras hygrometricum TaxID=472368 RepID=A0A2Z7CU20_9LAMI|nr:hypothetical protein F511_36871 [Dorcoceras hygrometricum]
MLLSSDVTSGPEDQAACSLCRGSQRAREDYRGGTQYYPLNLMLHGKITPLRLRPFHVPLGSKNIEDRGDNLAQDNHQSEHDIHREKCPQRIARQLFRPLPNYLTFPKLFDLSRAGLTIPSRSNHPKLVYLPELVHCDEPVYYSKLVCCPKLDYRVKLVYYVKPIYRPSWFNVLSCLEHNNDDRSSLEQNIDERSNLEQNSDEQSSLEQDRDQPSSLEQNEAA